MEFDRTREWLETNGLGGEQAKTDMERIKCRNLCRRQNGDALRARIEPRVGWTTGIYEGETAIAKMR